MKLDNITEEQLRKMITGMIDDRTLSEKVVKDKLSMYVSEDMKKACMLLHTIMCKADHNEECDWHKEANLDETWTRPSHKTWLDLTTYIRNFISAKNDKELLAQVVVLVDISNMIIEGKISLDLLFIYIDRIGGRDEI